jgi:NADH-quinone oxidoreductase subunit A
VARRQGFRAGSADSNPAISKQEDRPLPAAPLFVDSAAARSLFSPAGLWSGVQIHQFDREPPVDYLPPYLPLMVAIALAGVLGFGLLALAAVLGPKRISAVKASPFECGSNPVGSARQRFAVKFYVVALLFIVFDIETVMFYPWAVIFKELSWFGLLEMLVFVMTLAVGLVYVWKKGALEWE